MNVGEGLIASPAFTGNGKLGLSKAEAQSVFSYTRFLDANCL
jgi:hypothetical protein